ncbi:alpha/beta-Hydrolases superfamily protein [Striga asiatica]|uniref:Alpha/beta-Hydrolases superfamily protein n=1 Tax=Striga asiatica TaxID=4170 RepID=A0A5A7QPB4_STRAF|nr:alpha/beta-Hydrolases superfamily protein [Striga asiatica]
MGSEKETFSSTGPSFLTAIDWSNSNHRRSVAASLVQGVYVLESDRQQNRQGPRALAPPWWEFFGFRLAQVLIDDHDQSYFGAVFESNRHPGPPYPGHAGPRAPQCVVAFRGPIYRPDTRAEDLKLNLGCLANSLNGSSRFRVGFGPAREAASRFGLGNVWLAGHSVGSSVALLVGREMAKSFGAHLETYLFSPPFASAPIERIKSEKVKTGLRVANSVLTAGLALAAGSKAREEGPFAALAPWVPYLFVNRSDVVCSEYVGYFEHREKMEAIGAGKIGRLATKHSLGSIVSAARGKESEAAHLIPSAYLSINCGPSSGFREAHGIHQWWRQDLELRYKLYQYK